MNYQFFIIILHFLKICLIVSYNILCNILLKLLKLNVKTESNNSSSKLALDLQKEIKRRKLDKNPIKFKIKFESKLLKLNVKTESNNSSSKLALDLQKEIKRRKLDKNPIKFESKLKIALKEVLNRRRKMKTN